MEIKGDQPFSNCVLSVQVYSDEDKRIAIAAKCRWYRKYNMAKNRINTSSNTYHVSALDVGSHIVVEIEPIEEDERGLATVTFGPIALDPNTKKTL